MVMFAIAVISCEWPVTGGEGLLSRLHIGSHIIGEMMLKWWGHTYFLMKNYEGTLIKKW